MSKTKDNKRQLSENDKLVLHFVDKKKRTRNWIRDIIFSAYINHKIKGMISKSHAEYSLRKLSKLGLIKTEKWHNVHKRVYYK